MNLAYPTSPRPVPTGAARLWRRWGGFIIGAIVLILLAALVWYLLSDTASKKRQIAEAPMLMLPPPPPPPPEPEKLPEPEPEKVKPEIVEPKPTPEESVEPPKDDAPATPQPDLAAEPMTIDGAAQAGTDAFGISAGRGGGMTGGTGGGGLGSGAYANYFSNTLQQALARDPRTRNLVLDDMRLHVWLDASGKTTRAQLVKSSGNAQNDEIVLAMVREMNRMDETPPASLRLPIIVSFRGRRP